MARPRTHNDELRSRLMDEALEVVAAHGLASLALRALAERAGTSTTAVYALFGSKEALQRAVLLRAFEDFAANQESLPATDDPVTDIAGLGVLYVQWAVDHPRLYEAMFGGAIAGLAPSPEIIAAGDRAVAGVTDAVRRAIDAGVFRPADVATVVLSLWSQVHGLATLTIADHLPAGADAGTACFAVIEGWRA